MQEFDVCIIGAGASGTVCAIELAKQNKKVCLIDRFDLPAKKLLVTGNGRCNLTNKNMSSEFYNQNIDGYLNRFNQFDTIELFESYGLDTYFDEEGRCYPISNSAKTVQFLLINQTKKLGIDFVQDEAVDINFENETYSILTEQNKSIKSKAVVLACGINNFSKTVLQKFDIDTKKIVPSLVALKTVESTKKLSGQRVSNVCITANINGNTKTENGEILFKDNGVSGICVFNLSAFFAKNKEFLGKICINLLPKLQKTEIFENITKKMNIFEDMNDLLQSLFSKQLASEILNRADIKNEYKNINKNDIQKIVDTITNFEFNINGYYDNNQVLSGGADLLCLTENLESKKQKNLFVCGELCDVDGICGGYNLQWAWTSAIIVAKKLAD